jgi:hypothetical protein
MIPQILRSSISTLRRPCAFIFFLLTLTQCRMHRELGVGDTSNAGVVQGAETANPSGQIPKADGMDSVVWTPADDKKEIQGFGLNGAVSCLPMPNEARCIARPNPLRDRCLALIGIVMRCDDCLEICDKPLSPL